MAWGTKKKMFYDTDYVTTSKRLWSPATIWIPDSFVCVWLMRHFVCVVTEGRTQEELEAEEKEEEEEANRIQKRLAANLSEEDYDLNFFQVFSYCESLLYTCS